MPKTYDFVVSNHGSIFLFTPLTDAAREHLTDNVGDDAQWFGPALAVEHRYAAPLAEQLRDFGWDVRGEW